MILVCLFEQNEFKCYRYNLHFAKVKSILMEDFLLVHFTFTQKKNEQIYYYLSNTDISNCSKPLNNSFIIAVIFAQSPLPLPSTLSGILGSCKD